MKFDDKRIAAIMFTDIVGYSKAMNENESYGLEILRVSRNLQSRCIEKYGGQIVKEIGDGFLVRFESVSGSVNCAREILDNVLSESFRLTIGIHLGEVILEGDDIFGDDVNIAARLQSSAEPNQLVISQSVFSTLKDELKEPFISQGRRNLKNISEAVTVYVYSPQSIGTRKRRSKALILVPVLLIVGLAAALIWVISDSDSIIPSENDIAPCLPQETAHHILVAQFGNSEMDPVSNNLISNIRINNVSKNLQVSGSRVFLDITDPQKLLTSKDSIKSTFCTFNGLIVYGYFDSETDVLDCYVDLKSLKPEQRYARSEDLIIQPPDLIDFSITARTNYLSKIILALFYPRDGMYKESIEIFEEYLASPEAEKINPKLNFLSNYYLALCYLSIGDNDTARKFAGQAKLINPDSPVLQLSSLAENETAQLDNSITDNEPDAADEAKQETEESISLRDIGSGRPSGMITINEGRKVTDSRFVKLQIFATNTSRVVINNQDTLDFNPTNGNVMEIDWELDAGSGDKEINARFIDSEGRPSLLPSRANIQLDKKNAQE